MRAGLLYKLIGKFWLILIVFPCVFVLSAQNTVEFSIYSSKKHQKIKIWSSEEYAVYDFPTAIRKEAYEFVDRVLAHIPSPHKIE